MLTGRGIVAAVLLEFKACRYCYVSHRKVNSLATFGLTLVKLGCRVEEIFPFLDLNCCKGLWTFLVGLPCRGPQNDHRFVAVELLHSQENSQWSEPVLELQVPSAQPQGQDRSDIQEQYQWQGQSGA